jgi:hypothetical protein
MRFSLLRPFLNRFRKGAGAIYVPERFELTTNVHLIARERGKKVTERESHNVVVNSGRKWLRGLVSCIDFPDAKVPPDAGGGPFTPTALTVVPGDGSDVQQASAYRPRYIGFGTGSTAQNVTPPGKGAFTEVAARTGLERPVFVDTVDAADYYVGQIQKQSLADAEDAPDDYSIRFRRLFTEDEISYAGSNHVDAPFAVPLSEVLLLSSEYLDPTVSTVEDTPLGVMAYNTFATLTKTPNIQVEVIWEWRF